MGVVDVTTVVVTSMDVTVFAAVAADLARRARGVLTGEEYPIEVVVDLTGVSHVGMTDVGMVRGLARSVFAAGPMATTRVIAQGQPAKLLRLAVRIPVSAT